MNNLFYRWLCTNIFGFSLLIVAYINEWVSTVLSADTTNIIIPVIFGVFIWGTILCGHNIWKYSKNIINDKSFSTYTFVRYLANSLVLLGLIGTVMGFIVALSGVDPLTVSNIDSITPMVATLISGMSIALYTTLVGSIFNIWLSLNNNILMTGLAKHQ